MTLPITTYGQGQYVAVEAHTAFFPRFYRRSPTPRPLVIQCSGYTGTALTIFGVNFYSKFADMAEQLNCPVASADFGDGLTWGNDASIGKVTSLWTYAKANWGVATDKFVLLGGSMGSFTAQNYLKALSANVRACALILPGASLQDLHDNVPGYTPAIHDTINTAYGGANGADDSGFNAAKATHSTDLYAAPGIFGSVPIRAWYSTDDTVTKPSLWLPVANTIGGIHSASMGAIGHSQSAGSWQEIINWLKGVGV